MNTVTFELVKNCLLKHGIYITQATKLTYEYRGFDTRLPEFKDITIYGCHDLDGDVAHIFTIGNKRYTLPPMDAPLVLAYINNLEKDKESDAVGEV